MNTPDTPPVRSLKVVGFPEASHEEERVAAVLINRDANGNLRAYVKDVPGKNPPDPEVVALLVQSVELCNL